MNMNWIHRRYCAGGHWRRYVTTTLVPDGLADTDLGDDVLEIGPGPGLTTDVLRTRVPRLTALEFDDDLAAALRSRLPAGEVTVVHGDATAMPFDDGRFSAVVCFTMLHHVPTAELQDRLFAEACRVLRPGGVFTGSDSRGDGLLFRLIHVNDTMNLVDPATLGARLEAAGFASVEVRPGPRPWWRARA
jgi:SAM-dependent methyltransferase